MSQKKNSCKLKIPLPPPHHFSNGPSLSHLPRTSQRIEWASMRNLKPDLHVNLSKCFPPSAKLARTAADVGETIHFTIQITKSLKTQFLGTHLITWKVFSENHANSIILYCFLLSVVARIKNVFPNNYIIYAAGRDGGGDCSPPLPPARTPMHRGHRQCINWCFRATWWQFLLLRVCDQWTSNLRNKNTNREKHWKVIKLI